MVAKFVGPQELYIGSINICRSGMGFIRVM